MVYHRTKTAHVISVKNSTDDYFHVPTQGGIYVFYCINYNYFLVVSATGKNVEVQAGNAIDDFNFKQRGLNVGLQERMREMSR